jgi:PAS domain S-box-containing protein
METGATIGRMSAELGVVRASKNLETLFNSIDEMIFVLDMDGTIIWVNETVLRRLLYTRGELTGRDVISLHVPERQDEALCVLNEMIIGKRDSCPVALGAKDGSRIEVETKVTRGSWNDQQVLIGVSRDITERIAFERAHERNEELLRLILSVSTGFINVSAEGIDAEITDCLRSTGSFAGADRSYVFHISDDGTTMDNTHEWCADGIRPQMETLRAIPVDIFPWWMEKLGRGETIHVPRVQDLPDEAHTEKETLQSQQIRSVLVVPLIFKKKN